jgi:hypothetical protein
MKEEMGQIVDIFPNIPHFAISDSFFHATKPEHAHRYAISNKITKEMEIYRYGYHGLSVSSIVEKLKSENKLPKRTIVCHLGGGSSLTAVLDGKSIDNSMGYTPLEGVPMSTRSGSVDAGAVLAIMDNKNYNPTKMKEILSYESGMLAISELSSDIRDLLEASEKNNEKAILACRQWFALDQHVGPGGHHPRRRGDQVRIRAVHPQRVEEVRDRALGACPIHAGGRWCLAAARPGHAAARARGRALASSRAVDTRQTLDASNSHAECSSRECR